MIVATSHQHQNTQKILEQCPRQVVRRRREHMPLDRRTVECRAEGILDPRDTSVDSAANGWHRVRRLLASGGEKASARNVWIGLCVDRAQEEPPDSLQWFARIVEVVVHPDVDHALDVAVDGRGEEFISLLEAPIDRWRAEVKCDFEVPNGDVVAAALPGQRVGDIQDVGVRSLGRSAHLSTSMTTG